MAGNRTGDLAEHLRVADLARGEMEAVAELLDAECVAAAQFGDELVILAGAGPMERRSSGTLIGGRIPAIPPASAAFMVLGLTVDGSRGFRVRWAAHNVRFHRTGRKRLHHPLVGELELSYETLTLDADDGLRLALYTAEPHSASQHALDLLASWTATPPGEQRLADLPHNP